MAVCPTCGNTVSPEATVCPDCGMDLTSVAPAAETAAPAPASPPPATAPPTASAIEASPAIESIEAGDAPLVAVPSVAAAAAGVEPAGEAVLTLRRGGVLMPDKFFIGTDVILGRFDTESGPVDIDFAPLPEASYISRHHARLKRHDNGRWTVQDLGSRNGTYVRNAGNGQFVRITGEHAVGDGDEIALGNARFLFSLVQPSGISPAA